MPGLGIDDRVAMVDMSGVSATAVHYYATNRLGSVIGMVDSAGVLTDQYLYSPFGVEEPLNGSGNPYRYTGRYYDGETGLYYYRSRYYDTAGRFLEPDSILYDGGLNLYAYVGGDPINNVDPLGECCDRKTNPNSAFRKTANGFAMRNAPGRSLSTQNEPFTDAVGVASLGFAGLAGAGGVATVLAATPVLEGVTSANLALTRVGAVPEVASSGFVDFTAGANIGGIADGVASQEAFIVVTGTAEQVGAPVIIAGAKTVAQKVGLAVGASAAVAATFKEIRDKIRSFFGDQSNTDTALNDCQGAEAAACQ